MVNNLRDLKLLISKYWQGIVTAVTAVFALPKLYYDYTKGSSKIQLIVTLSIALLVVCIIRFPRIVFLITRLIVGQPKLPPDLRIFRGPLPYFEGDKLPARRSELDACLQLLQQSPFFILQGESGSGKSSFLNASLKPKLKERYRIVECRIIVDPFGWLIRAFLQKVVVGSDRISKEEELLNAISWAQLNYSNNNDKSDERKPIILVIDQFEELFVTVREDDRVLLMECLKKAIARGEIKVVLTIRNDFLDLLLTLCRKVDPDQQVYNLGSFYVLLAFPENIGKLVLDEMLKPLHEDDPLRKEQLDKFSKNLVLELLRPPRDKRIFQGDEKSILPVELQITGMMIEFIGIQNVIDKGIESFGGKTELLRAYIERAKDYVWQKTGVPGDKALLIIRQLVSPARTKWAQTPENISKNIGMSGAQIESVLKAFAEQYLVKPLPLENGSAIQYDLMHEHLVWVLVEAPQQILQKARDAEERLQFWNKRTESTFANSKPDVGKSRKAKVRLLFAQPIPISETISLWRFATRQDDKRMLKRNVKGFTMQMLAFSLPLMFIASIFLWWVQTDKYLIKKIISNAPTELFAISEEESDIELLKEWSKALVSRNIYSNAFAVIEKIKDDQDRSDAFSDLAVAFISKKEIALADSAFVQSFSINGISWEVSQQNAVFLLAEGMSRNGSEMQLYKQVLAIENSPLKLHALVAFMEGSYSAGKHSNGDSIFNEVFAEAKKIKVYELKRDLFFEIVDNSIKENRNQHAKAGLEVIFNDSLYNFNILQSLSNRYINNKDLESAKSIWVRALSLNAKDWQGDFVSYGIANLTMELSKIGKEKDLLRFSIQDTDDSVRLFKSRFTTSVVAGMMMADVWDSGKDQMFRKLHPIYEFAAYSAALNKLIDNGRFNDAGKMMNVILRKPIPTLLVCRRYTFSLGNDEATSFYSFLSSLIRLKNYDSALAVALRQDCDLAAVRYSEAVDQVEQNSPVGYVLKLMIKNKDYEIAYKNLNKIKSLVERNYILAIIAIERLKLNQVEEANRLIDELITGSENIKYSLEGVSSDEKDECIWLNDDYPVSFASIEAAKMGNYALSFKLCDYLFGKYKYTTLTAIADVLVKANKIDFLDGVIQRIDNVAIRSETLSNMVSAFADSGRLKNAMIYVDWIRNPDDLSRANAAIAKCEARNRNFRKAAQFADRCFSRDKLSTYTYILNQYSKKK